MPISVQVTGSGAYTTPPGVVGGTPPTPTYIAKIVYDGVDITPVVIYADAQFTTAVNGTPGSCQFRVRDDSHQFTFQVGRRIELSINGLAEWTGYVSRVRRSTAFADGPASQTRFLIIEGVDINVLFRRRYVLKKSDPKNVAGVTYKAGTPTKDTTAIAELVTNYLDLSGDDLDTSSLVTNVDNINVDQDANPFAGSWTWEQAMASINSLASAVWYINPDRKLVWADVDTATAPFGLSDTPNNSTTYGYREMEIGYDGGGLVNDYLVWGAGQGSPNAIVKRLQSPSSQTTHGRWQASAIKTDVYKQATLDRIASSFVNGSPSSKRGHKDDKVSVTCTTYRQGLRAGMGVAFSCSAFGYSDVLPVRQVRITFPSPTQPRYDLVLSHEIDSPWNFTDVYHPKITMPKWPNIGWWNLILGDGCATDDFDRITVGGFGTGNVGSWYVYAGDSGAVSTDGTYGLMALTDSAHQNASAYLQGSGIWSGDFDMYTRIYVDVSNVLTHDFAFKMYDDAGNLVVVVFTPVGKSFADDSVAKVSLSYDDDAYPLDYGRSSIDFSGSSSGWYLVRLSRSGVFFQGKIWKDGTAEPGWQVSVSMHPDRSSFLFGSSNYLFGSGVQFRIKLPILATSGTGKIDYLKFCPTNVGCTTDDFDRTLSGTLGSSVLGTWNTTLYGSASLSLSGSVATCSWDANSNSGANSRIFGAGSWSNDFEMTARVYVEPTTAGYVGFYMASPYATVQANASLIVGYTTGNGRLVFYLDVNELGGQNYIYSNNVPFPSINGWYMVKWARSGSTFFAKYWADGTTEPVSWQLSSNGPAEMSGLVYSDNFALYLQNNSYASGSAYAGQAKIDYITFCPPDATPSTITETIPGEITASMTGNGAITIPLGPFFRGTTRIFKNGIIQRQGIDYTESPGAGEILFATPTSTSDKIVAHFVAATPTNGGVSRRAF